jgi:hypothetical protein
MKSVLSVLKKKHLVFFPSSILQEHESLKREKDIRNWAHFSAGRDRDVLVLLQQRPVTQLRQRLGGPPGALGGQRQRERHVDDDLLLGRLGPLGDGLDVLAPDGADPPGDVDEADGRDQRLAGVAVAQREARVGDEVRQAVGAAEEAGLGVVGKALVGAVDGGLEGEGGGRALLVLF